MSARVAACDRDTASRSFRSAWRKFDAAAHIEMAMLYFDSAATTHQFGGRDRLKVGRLELRPSAEREINRRDRRAFADPTRDQKSSRGKRQATRPFAVGL